MGLFKLGHESTHIWWTRLTQKQPKQLTRQLLAHYCNTSEDALTFKHNSRGKPVLQHYPIHFNVSHTPHFYVLAISTHPVGIDCESNYRHTINGDIVKRLFDKQNQLEFHQLQPSLKTQLFLRGWTKYEAYIKYHGLSIFSPAPYLPNLWSPCPTRHQGITITAQNIHPMLITSIASTVQAVTVYPIE